MLEATKMEKETNIQVERTPQAGDVYWIKMKDREVGHEKTKRRPCLLLHPYEDGNIWEVAALERARKNPRYERSRRNWKRVHLNEEDVVVLLGHRDCISSQRFCTEDYFATISREDLVGAYKSLINLYSSMRHTELAKEVSPKMTADPHKEKTQNLPSKDRTCEKEVMSMER